MTSWSVRRDLSVSEASEKDGAHPGTEVFVIEESLGYLLNRAARRIAAELADELRPDGIAIGQWAVLIFLWARDGQTQAELSRHVAIEQATMVRTIDRMVRDGLVTREPDPADGRLARIRLTPRGGALRDVLIPKAVGINRAARGLLTEKEFGVLMRALRTLAEGRLR